MKRLIGGAALAAGGSWLPDKQRDGIVRVMKDIANIPGETLNPAKLQVARPVRAYYYNGAGYEQDSLLYPLVYQGQVKYLDTARAEVSGLLFTHLEGALDVEDAYLGRLPRVPKASTAD